MWKILTVQIREKIYYSLTNRGLYPEEEKGYRKVSRGTRELLYIYQHILNETKTRRKTLAIVWIAYKKVYDKVPQSWIINSPKMYKISHEIINFIEKTMITCVVYWPTSQPGCQNRKCTYVNNRCIRSRNIRIIILTVDRLNECNCDAHKKKGALIYYITRWRQEVS